MCNRYLPIIPWLADATKKRLIKKVRARGYIITKISSDSEKAFAGLDGIVDVHWDTVGSRTHEDYLNLDSLEKLVVHCLLICLLMRLTYTTLLP